MITAYNPLSNPQITNTSTQTDKLPGQAGQSSVANSNFFASVITQLLMQMELQSETGSQMENLDPSMFMDSNQTFPQSGINYPANQSINPFDSFQMMGNNFPGMPLNFNSLISTPVLDPSQNVVMNDSSQNLPLKSDVANIVSVNPYKTTTINLTPATGNNGSLQYHPIDAGRLNAALGGKLQGMGEAFVKAGQEYNVDPALLASIAKHETGNGTSLAANMKNNIAGMMGAGGLKSYATVEDSITDMARNIGKYYLGAGLASISQIGAKYAAVGRHNDPSGLNNYWLSGVTRYYNQLRPQTTVSPLSTMV